MFIRERFQRVVSTFRIFRIRKKHRILVRSFSYFRHIVVYVLNVKFPGTGFNVFPDLLGCHQICGGHFIQFWLNKTFNPARLG
jgi:hypothetical protein